MLTYSILIPTLNRPQLLKNLLASVEQQTRAPHEVILVDQSDDLETKNFFDHWNPVRFLQLKKRYIHLNEKSLVKARNTGIHAATSDLVCFMDDDATFNPEFAQVIVEIFEKDTENRYAGGTGHIVGFTKKRRLLQTLFLMPHEGNGYFLASGVQTYPHWKKEFCETEFVSGGCTFWRRSIIAEYRFDKRLNAYGHGEDVDISYRISRKFKNFYQPKAKIFLHSHPFDKHLNKDSGRRFRRAWVQNFYYLAIKNRIFLPAFYWCVLGHFLRDLVCFDFSSLLGDGEGLWKILIQQIETVEGYKEFKQERKNREVF